METKSWITVDKISWGDGPWQSEPDKQQWTDPATGYPCLIHRSVSTGALCGYVGIPPTHPWFGKGYDDVYDQGVDIDVHGGLTYSGGCEDSPDPSTGICHYDPGSPPIHWFGFDCSHAGDYSPAMEARLRSYGHEPPLTYNDRYRALSLSWFEEFYRDVAYVEEQCANLAAQLKAAEDNREGR